MLIKREGSYSQKERVTDVQQSPGQLGANISACHAVYPADEDGRHRADQSLQDGCDHDDSRDDL